jgi:hypothetical protein
MKGQKQAVIDEVLAQLPNFVRFKDKAILALSNTQLESVKENVRAGIQSGLIEYSKSLSDVGEVRTYARSMVMNHLKKAKELNGNMIPGQAGSGPKAVKLKDPAKKGVDMTLLPEDFREYLSNLV